MISSAWLGAFASMSMATLMSRVLGFVREVVFAMAFGSSAIFDAYVLATRIPSTLRRLFAEGTLTQAFVPVLTELEHYGSPASIRSFKAQLLFILLLITSSIALVFMLFPKAVLAVYASGLGADDPRLTLASRLLPLVALFLPGIVVVSFLTAILNVRHDFFLGALVPAISNVVLIVLAYSYRGDTLLVWAVSWGVLLGVVLQIVIVLWRAQRLGQVPGIIMRFDHPELARVGQLLLAGALGLSATQLSLIVDTNLASFLPVGSLSWLYYAERLVYLPLGTIGVSVATVSLPAMSRSFQQKDEIKQTQALHQAAHMVLFLGVPAALGLGFAGHIWLQILFERGLFSHHDTLMSSQALQLLSLGLPFMMFVKIWVSAAYALQKPRWVIVSTLLAVVANLLVAIGTLSWLLHGAIALGVSVGAMVQALYLAFCMRRTLALPLFAPGVWKLFFAPWCSITLSLVLGCWYFYYYPIRLLMVIPWFVLTVLIYFAVYYVAQRNLWLQKDLLKARK